MSSDERLAKRATQGDPRAFEAIYRRYHQDLYRFCLAMVGNAQDAQDALQNTMIKALGALPGEEREIQLKPWLFKIARNESVETLRKRRDNAELEPHHALAPSVTETAEARERLRTLLGDLEQLPERQRAALVMRELSGLDFDQIGAAFGSSAAVARQTLYEARLSLRQLEAGREMRCADVMRELSDADGRVTRRREIRAHLRGCTDCRAFRDEITRRHDDLASLTPLPVAASAALLHGAFGKAAATGGAAVGGGGLAGSVGAGAGQVAATSAIVKSAATVAVVAVVGVSAVDRGGLIDLPLSGKNDPGSTQGGPGSDAPVGAADAAEAANPAPRPASAATDRSSDGNESEGQGQKAEQGDGGARSPLQDDVAAAPGNGSSNSQAGMNPPGGGHGRSASGRQGRPDGLPQAAGHGQQTAAAKKPAQAASPASNGGPAESQGKQHGESASGEKSAPPSKAKAPAAATVPQPPNEAPSQAGGNAAQPGSGTIPPGLQR